MVKMTGTYNGDKRCTAQHEPSQSNLETDAPKDNHGRGEKFSPTDLVATALGTCILTTLAIVYEKEGLSFAGSTFSVVKEMTPPPRKIASLKIVIQVPKAIPVEFREKIAHSAEACPVKRSLHADITAPIEIQYIL